MKGFYSKLVTNGPPEKTTDCDTATNYCNNDAYVYNRTVYIYVVHVDDEWLHAMQGEVISSQIGAKVTTVVPALHGNSTTETGGWLEGVTTGNVSCPLRHPLPWQENVWPILE